VANFPKLPNNINSPGKFTQHEKAEEGLQIGLTPIEKEDQLDVIHAKIENKEVASWKSLIDLSSIDLNKIQEGTLQMSVPFKSGRYTLPGLYENADVKVKKGTHAILSIAVVKNEKQESIMQGVTLEFNPPLKIKNPASAFDHGNYVTDKIKDLLADVIIRGLAISKEGKISLDGAVLKGVLGDEDLGTRISANQFPTVDMNLKSLFESNGKKSAGSFFKSELHPWKFFDVLKQIGAMTEHAQYELKMKTDDIAISAASKDCRLWTEKAPSEINFRGSAKITSSGEIEINNDSLRSHISTRDMTVHIGGEGVVSNLDQDSPTIFAHLGVRAEVKKAQGEAMSAGVSIPFTLGEVDDFISGNAFIKVDADRHVVLKDASSLAFHLHARLPKDFSVKKDPGSIKINSGDLQMRAGVNFEFKKNLQINSGTASLQATMTDMQAEALGYRGVLDGKVGAGITAKDIKKSGSDHYPSFSGKAEYSLTSTALSTQKSSGFKAFKGVLDYRFKANNTISLESGESGLTQMISPVLDLVWSPENICSSKTPAAGPIGSPAWRQRIEQITGAPIRKGNQAELLIDGVKAYPKKLELINNAQKSICMQALAFKDDKTGMSIAQALVDAKNRGVDVHVIVDSLGNIGSFREFMKGNKAYQLLEKNQVNFQLYNGALEQGIKEVIEVIAGNEKLQEKMVVIMGDMSQAMGFFHDIVEAANGDINIGLSPENREKLTIGLSRMWGGQQGIAPEEALEQLFNLSTDKTIHLSDVAEILKKMGTYNYRWHEKYLIVDGKKAILGSMNVSDAHLLGGTGKMVGSSKKRPAWSDLDLLLTGPAVQDAYRHFSDNWEIVSGERLPKLQPEVPLNGKAGADIQVVHGQPRIHGDHNMVNLLVESVKALEAGQKFYTAVAYFVPTGAFDSYAEALIDAAKRGVDVRVITNSEKSTDLPQVVQAAKSVSYRKLLQGGVRLFECSSERTLHTKATSIGSQAAIIGSANANNRTGSLDSESVAVVHNAPLAQEIEKVILANMDPSVANEIHLEDIEYGPVMEQLRNAAFATLKDCM
jgi:phosphatidylserine/phosphatidylglycerophosphate/cardiolipin synthase-like enzyme